MARAIQIARERAMMARMLLAQAMMEYGIMDAVA
jgi:hypothetical protein